MKVLQSVTAAVFVLVFCPVAASAQGDKCPRGYSNDDCDKWHFERADIVLTEAIDRKIAQSSSMTTSPDIRDEIKRTALEAHRAWVAYREAECKAYAVANVTSARTQQGKYASCLLRLTEQRVAELNKP